MPLPFLIALQFLTTVPVYINVPPEPRDHGASLDWYGAVGLVLGLLLALAGWLLSFLVAPMVAASLVLVLWVLLTGALHLDGLGDCVDGCLGSSRERAFEIMKDPRAGPMAVAAICLVLLVKFAAVATIAASGSWILLVVAPIIARAGVQVLFLTTPYVSKQGIGSAMAEHLVRDRVSVMVVVAVVLTVFLAGASSWVLLPAILVVFALTRYLMMRKLLGTTGDSAGAMVEILEVASLAVLVS